MKRLPAKLPSIVSNINNNIRKDREILNAPDVLQHPGEREGERDVTHDSNLHPRESCTSQNLSKTHSGHMSLHNRLKDVGNYGLLCRKNMKPIVI